MVCGVWYVACGVWCVVYGVWCVVYGVWCMACGLWCVIISQLLFRVFADTRSAVRLESFDQGKNKILSH